MESMSLRRVCSCAAVLVVALSFGFGPGLLGAQTLGPSVYTATLMEPNQKTGEVSTEELRQALSDGSTTVYDSRAPLQYALGHIPGALNVPDLSVTPATAGHVAGIQQLIPNKDSAIILYCNGPI